MEITKGHLCPTCGGALQIDESRQLYMCPYCGVTFDYEYFREGDVLLKARQSMAVSEFNSAQQAYKFMLKKDPHNFEALRGLVFSEAKIPSYKVLNDIEFYPQFPYKTVKEKFDIALESALPDDRKFFEIFGTLMEKGEQYKNDLEDDKKLSSERKKLEHNIDKLDKAAEAAMPAIRSYDDGEPVHYHPKKGLNFTLVLYGIFMLFFLIMSLGKEGSLDLLLYVFCLTVLPVAGLTIYFLVKMHQVNEVYAEQASLIREANALGEKINALRDDAEKMRREITLTVHDLKKADPLSKEG